MKQQWIEEELIKLRELCKSSRSFADLKMKVKSNFGERTWLAVRAKVYQHKDWFSHFANEEKFLNFLEQEERRPKSFNEISNLLDVPKEEIYPLRDALAEKGYDIEVKDSHVFLKSEPNDGKSAKIPKITSNVVKILVLSDICFGLKTQQPTLVETAYKIGEEARVFFAIICGNIVAGKPPKGKDGEYFLPTYEEQLQYAIEHLPKASFKTTFINGPREMSWKITGQNIGEALAKARQDLSYKDDLKTNFHIGRKEKTIIAVMHAGESSAYTKSYTLQGIAENLQEAERYVFEHSDPLQLIIIGGLHTGIHDPRRFPIKKSRINDFCKINVPSLYRVTPSQTVSKRRGGAPVLGCAIVSFELDEEGYLKSLPVCEFHNLTSYFKENDYEDSDGVADDQRLEEKEKNLLDRLVKKPRRLGALARILGISGEHIKAIIKNLNDKGFVITFEEASKSYKWEKSLRKEFKPLDTKQFCAKSAKILSFSDTHIGHKHERADLIEEVYKIAEAEKVDAIFHSGDVFEGEDSFKGQSRELAYHGADSQRDRALAIWPASKIPTFFIAGTSHGKVFLDKCGHDIDATFARLVHLEKGANVAALLGGDGICESRGVVEVKGIKFCLDHPSGGLPYGRSYRPQKLIENLVSEMELTGEAKILLCGHLHVAFFMLYKGLAGFLVPCLQEKTKYIEAKGYTPWLGAWIVEVVLDQYENITKIVPRYIPFEPKIQHQVYNLVQLGEG